MDKLKMHSQDKVKEHVAQIAALFPNTLTETIKDGKVEQAIDFDILKQELSDIVVDGPAERYQFTWPDKKKSILLANAPITKTLRPFRKESLDFDTTKNLYIEGDNLDALKLLQETYLGKVNMIYIDPPYNTGNDFIYDDDFSQEKQEYLPTSGQFNEEGGLLVENPESNGRFHTDWLNMMFPRLKLAKDLLSNDGVIFISIDDNEVENLRKMCDEIFGRSNFVAQIIIQANKGGQDYLPLAKTHEYLLCYFKSSAGSINLLPKNDTSSFKYSDKKGKYELREVRNRNPKFSKANRPNLYFPIYINPEIKDEYECCPVSLNRTEKYNIEVFPINSEGNFSCWRWGKELMRKNIIIDFPSESNLVGKQRRDGGWNVYEKNRKMETKAKTIWDETEVRTERGTIVFGELFNSSFFAHPKPVELIYKALQLATDEDALVFDFFSGSGTTAHAVMQLNSEDGGNRKFILVQLPEVVDVNSEAAMAGYANICEIGKERIRRAGKKIMGEAGLLAQTLDTGFRVFKIDTTNMEDVYYTPGTYQQNLLNSMADNIKMDRTAEDLLFQVMLDLGILLSSSIQEIIVGGKKVYSVADGYLLACFDNNVNSETVTEIAKRKPYYAIFRDSSMSDDSVATNFDQIFATYSPTTVRKVL